MTKDDSFWHKIWWSDESKFNLYGPDGPLKAWKRKKELMRIDTIRQVNQQDRISIMVWGAFHSKGVGN